MSFIAQNSGIIWRIQRLFFSIEVDYVRKAFLDIVGLGSHSVDSEPLSTTTRVF